MDIPQKALCLLAASLISFGAGAFTTALLTHREGAYDFDSKGNYYQWESEYQRSGTPPEGYQGTLLIRNGRVVSCWALLRVNDSAKWSTGADWSTVKAIGWEDLGTVITTNPPKYIPPKDSK